MIEPVEEEDNESSEESLEPKEEVMEEEPQSVDFTMHVLAGYSNPQTMKVGGLLRQQPITVLIDTGNTNNFLNSKVATHMALHIKGCNKFNVKVADGWILKCDQWYSRVKLLLQDQEIVAGFFLLPIDDYEVVSPKVNRSLLGIRQELAKGDREFARSALEVHQKMIERLVGSSLEDAGKFAGSSPDQLTCRTTRVIVFVCLSVS
ncbi:hypothetical protein BHE74_00004987 [Ensete ventricosum]|nr:hypothetical protein BHE74_00004987 [Ensete ventricosum]